MNIISRPFGQRPDSSPIFLLGTGRSGTTLLRQILNAHPRIYLTNEAFFYSYSGFSPHLSATEWMERYFDTFSFAWLQLDPEEVRRAVPKDLPRERIADVFKTIMRMKAANHGKLRFGEKSPLDTENLDRIFKDFPDARVIYIMRDPRATVQSYTRMPWGTSSLSLASTGCARQLKFVAPYFDRIHELTLEGLLENPRKVLGEILEFIGEPWDDAVLNHTEHSPIDDVAPFPWFHGATRKKPKSQSGVPLWRKVLSPEWIRIIEKDNAFGMERYGYEPARLEQEPNKAKRIAAQLADAPEAMLTITRYLKALPKIWNFNGSDSHRTSPQKSMEAHLTFNPKSWNFYPDFEMPQVPNMEDERYGKAA